MRVFGWILLVLGLLSFIGCMMGGDSGIGPLLLIVLGTYLISRANKKRKEEEKKKKWVNGNN